MPLSHVHIVPHSKEQHMGSQKLRQEGLLPSNGFEAFDDLWVNDERDPPHHRKQHHFEGRNRSLMRWSKQYKYQTKHNTCCLKQLLKRHASFHSMSSLDSCMHMNVNVPFILDVWVLHFKRPAPRNVGNWWELPSQPRHLLSHFPFFKIQATLIPLCLRFRNLKDTSYPQVSCFQKNHPSNTSASQAIQVVWVTKKRRDSAVSRAESWRYHPGTPQKAIYI